MPANRGLVALVALAVVVWGVAFAGGATVAVLTASVDVTTTFETPDELSQIDEPAGDGTAAVAVENGTTGVNETGATANATGPSDNVSAPTDGNTSSPPETPPATDGNESAPADGNASAPDDDASAPADGNTSSPPGTGSEPSETGEPLTNESSGGENATDVSAVAAPFDADRQSASERSNGA